jgi:hypothetical protein
MNAIILELVTFLEKEQGVLRGILLCSFLVFFSGSFNDAFGI